MSSHIHIWSFYKSSKGNGVNPSLETVRLLLILAYVCIGTCTTLFIYNIIAENAKGMSWMLASKGTTLFGYTGMHPIIDRHPKRSFTRHTINLPPTMTILHHPTLRHPPRQPPPLHQRGKEAADNGRDNEDTTTKTRHSEEGHRTRTKDN